MAGFVPAPPSGGVPGYTNPKGGSVTKKPTTKVGKTPKYPSAFQPTLTYGVGTPVYDSAGNLIHRVDIKGIQNHLRAVGYDIKVTGKLDPITKSALGDYLRPNKQHPVGAALAQLLRGTTLTGRRNPKAWSTRFGLGRATKKVERPLTGAGGQLNKFGNDPVLPPSKGGGGGGLKGLSISIPSPLLVAPGLATQGLDPLPEGYADAQAGIQFDPQIHEAQVAQSRLPARTAQDLHDIETWYGNAMNSQKVAAQRDSDIGKSTRQSVQDATQAIIASLGGSANAGTGVVGAAGADSLGTLAALSQSQDQYNQDVAPIMALEKAGAMANEQHRGNTDEADLRNQLMGLQGQRGQAKVIAMGDRQKYNQSLSDTAYNRAMQIKQYNDSIGQQNFQNRMSVNDANTAALLAGAKYASAANKPAKWAFGAMSSGDRAAARGGMVQAVQQQLQSTHSVPQAVSYLGSLIRSQGWSFSNPQVKQFAFNVLQLAGIPPDAKWFH